jgi:uncharacterized protein GlcG (DUF336 family)
MSSLTLAQANKIVETALAKAREMKIKPLAVAVLDQSGHVKSMQREDGASMFRCDVAIGKAWASVGMGVASRTLLQRAKENPQFFGALSATAQGKFLPQTGAVVIKDAQGNVLGAAGASGGTGEEDEAVCIAGVEAAGSRRVSAGARTSKGRGLPRPRPLMIMMRTWRSALPPIPQALS